ncbi:hypothetical protein [Shimia sp. FJ5]|uniref:hypothetical protein n=1 Tax=Shimia sp. FJ5 TaxID=3079054 RepID=UPI00293DA741|nr:hypothetical protein [Shimia sp. FJ5]MDV4145838.1 hypothetical protein [Shimia sp. FJ5]
MRNTYAVRQFLDAAAVARDPLDATACRRAAAWLRWCDGYGATLAQGEAERIAQGGALGDCARQIIRRLAEEFPAPVEDAGLTYLDDDEGGGWMQNIPKAPGAARTARGREAEDERPEVHSPFGDMEPGL